ncbi:Ohr family peroxiredoxin [Asanoa sp. WMMD1127]|uniref:Ohr family peroxiredoxin n=1 Tax=Asanoa sp. WMMD1127 TaxID=3016107 RepID=UPI002415AD56|nr:Ohr family peroxiredoxin [Asanoa sp. WMMD1127]MDG4820778.1 Ohr family peroxiredoxin [Asanoa sp. WMMD1127]
MALSRVLYRTGAVAEGGRAGRVRVDDGGPEFTLAVPAGLGGDDGAGVNPEQLFAAGYAACFQSALENVASGYGVDLAGSRVRVGVALGPTGRGGLGLAVDIDLDAPTVDPDEAGRLLHRAHRFCPYSQAIAGNVEVTLSVRGAPVPAS